jgi:DNA-directed RNA polymerase specialized sigma24 family protein
VDPPSEAQESRELISRCLAGDPDASREFQEQYGELIYGYPIRVFRFAPEDAGDFYVFAFENGRIFRRLRTFEGRAPLRAYLLGFALDDLVLEWKRGEREIETVSIELLGEIPGDDGSMHNISGSLDARDSLREVLSNVEPAKAVVMKLLHIEDYELSPQELRHVSSVSGKPVRDVLTGVNQLRSTVREREAALKQLQDAVDAVHAWIQLYERRLRRIDEDLSALPPTAPAAERLREEQADLLRRIERRRAQRVKLLDRAQRRKVTAPYKDIASLLNTTVGNVGSQIARLRQELSQKAFIRSTLTGYGEH